MAHLTLKGNPVTTNGELPKVGEKIKDFELIKIDSSSIFLKDLIGQQLVLNIFPSVDTGTCAASVREFNKRAVSLQNTKVLCISRDFPFAHKRFCGAEGIENVLSLSDFNTGKFGKDNGLEITTGVLNHLHSRVVMILDEKGIIKYIEQVSEISSEPNYEEALSALV